MEWDLRFSAFGVARPARMAREKFGIGMHNIGIGADQVGMGGKAVMGCSRP